MTLHKDYYLYIWLLIEKKSFICIIKKTLVSLLSWGSLLSGFISSHKVLTLLSGDRYFRNSVSCYSNEPPISGHCSDQKECPLRRGVRPLADQVPLYYCSLLEEQLKWWGMSGGGGGGGDSINFARALFGTVLCKLQQLTKFTLVIFSCFSLELNVALHTSIQLKDTSDTDIYSE